MTSSKIAAFLICAASLCVGGCDGIAPTRGNGQGSATSSVAGDADQLDAYIGAHNRLVGPFGFYERANYYREADVAHASTDNQFIVGDGSIERGIEQLTEARAMSGAPADLNAAADALIKSMTRVRAHLAELESYYTSKAYLDDKLARGRKEDPQMLAEIEAADADLTRFSDLIDRNMDKREAAMLETLKAKGALLEYNSRLAMSHGRALMTLFKGSEGRDASLFPRADAEVAIIQKAIAAAHAEAAKAGEKDPAELDSLSSMLGSYRSFKQNGRPADARQMLESYNNAVQSANR
ncbi:DUF3829 domain-containing protein [Sphingomonas arantia]|uniref:DUF3829 domain-containing protein n=1 Tax=Sphingomonas arantia TaxID=1460676 RepID=A0ABW4TZJ0_9SPHN